MDGQSGNGTPIIELPGCQKCGSGRLLPFSDYGQEGASIMFKSWACTNPACGFYLRVDKGDIHEAQWVEVVKRVISGGK